MKIEYYPHYAPVIGKAADIEFNPEIEVGGERLVNQGWQFTNAQDRRESLQDNLEMFKEASDALVAKMDRIEPDWKNMDYHVAVMHMNNDFRRAYRAWRRARAGIDSTLATIAADNREEANDGSKLAKESLQSDTTED